MYPEQIVLISMFTSKFDSTTYAITKFIRSNRLLDGGIEKRKCSNVIHDMEINQTAYIFNGKPFELKSFFCSDMRCFLENLDSESVKKFLESIEKK